MIVVFPDPFGSEKPDDLALLDLKRHVLHGDGGAELLSQLLDFDHPRHVIFGSRVDGQTGFKPTDDGALAREFKEFRFGGAAAAAGTDGIPRYDASVAALLPRGERRSPNAFAGGAA